MKKTLFILSVLTLFYSCKREKYVVNRFAGVYEITGIHREVWDSTGKVAEEELPGGYRFFLEAPENTGFGDGSCKIDTFGQEPSFLSFLGLNNFQGMARFTCSWNIGPGDNVRLSFLKPSPSGIGDNSVSVNIKRNAIGLVTSWTYFKLTGDGGFIFEEYKINKK